MADGHTRWEADGYLLSLPSYPLLIEKTRLIGNMFQVNPFVHDWDEHVREDEETLLEPSRRWPGPTSRSVQENTPGPRLATLPTPGARDAGTVRAAQHLVRQSAPPEQIR